MAKIVSTPEVLGGKPRIEGRRISVLHVVDQIQSGRTPEEVTTQFDLTLSEVYSALSYYHEHPEKMRELRERRQETIENTDFLRPEDVGLEPREPEGKSDGATESEPQSGI